MLKIPFHIERALELSVFLGCVSLVAFVVWWAYTRNVLRIGDLLAAFFRVRFRRLDAEKARSVGGKLLGFFSILFPCMALFTTFVAVGIIENGEKEKIEMAPELKMQSEALQKYLDSNGGKVDIQELMRQSKSKE